MREVEKTHTKKKTETREVNMLGGMGMKEEKLFARYFCQCFFFFFVHFLHLLSIDIYDANIPPAPWTIASRDPARQVEGKRISSFVDKIQQRVKKKREVSQKSTTQNLSGDD